MASMTNPALQILSAQKQLTPKLMLTRLPQYERSKEPERELAARSRLERGLKLVAFLG